MLYASLSVVTLGLGARIAFCMLDRKVQDMIHRWKL